jgi:hypothetical protein
LLGEPGKIIPQRLQIFLKIAGSRTRGFAEIARALARFTAGVTHVAGNCRRIAHAITP